MDEKEIKKYIEFMGEHDLCHFELVRGDDSLTLKKKGADDAPPAAAQPMAFQPMPSMAAPPAPPAVQAGGASEEEGDAASTESSGAPKTYIDSPMVGTFYRSPDPDSPQFVKVGDFVEEDTTVCIIESMKVMNEIKAEKRGKIVEISAEDTKPVQFGEHLFVIE